MPEDVKVVGFDDLEISRRTSPPLTSIRQDLEAGADALVDLLFRKISGEPVESLQLEPTLAARGSTLTA